MAGTEEVDGCVGPQAALGRGDDVDHIVVPVVVHQRHDRADREDIEIRVVGVATGPLAEVRIGRPLNGRADEHLARVGGFGDLESVLRGLEIRLGTLAGDVRRGRDVDGRGDIGADLALEGEDLLRRDVDLAVLRELEGAGVGHDRAREIEQVVEALLERAFAEVVVAVDDIGVRDEDFRAELVGESARADRIQIRIDNREQGRGFDGRAGTRNGEFPDAAAGVGVPDFEGLAHCPPVGPSDVRRDGFRPPDRRRPDARSIRSPPRRGAGRAGPPRDGGVKVRPQFRNRPHGGRRRRFTLRAAFVP